MAYKFLLFFSHPPNPRIDRVYPINPWIIPCEQIRSRNVMAWHISWMDVFAHETPMIHDDSQKFLPENLGIPEIVDMIIPMFSDDPRCIPMKWLGCLSIFNIRLKYPSLHHPIFFHIIIIPIFFSYSIGISYHGWWFFEYPIFFGKKNQYPIFSGKNIIYPIFFRKKYHISHFYPIFFNLWEDFCRVIFLDSMGFHSGFQWIPENHNHHASERNSSQWISENIPEYPILLVSSYIIIPFYILFECDPHKIDCDPHTIWYLPIIL